ncbi:MAG: FtsW/RodA/SpoVE family cell cycle protein [bacterium]
MKNDRKIDLLLVLPLVSIVFLGLVTLNSALSYAPSRFYIQLLWLFIASGIFLFTSYINPRIWNNSAVVLAAVNAFLLILVLVLGKQIGGAKRWLDLGFVRVQVSEITKFSTILFLAHRLNFKPTFKDGYRIKDLIPEMAVVGFSLFLIYLEPDLGTTLIIMFTAVTMVAVSKINKKELIILIVILTVTAPLIWTTVFRPYQKKRIKSLVSMVIKDRMKDSDIDQYHSRQSLIAIGSGKISGKGHKQGTQNILRFIPEHYTDFIFSVYAEEFGLSGVLLLFILYIMLFLRMLKIVTFTPDKFSALVVVGSVSLLSMQTIINIGMVSGILPVVGIPLPFFSYGGSSLVLNFAMLGIVHNFSLRKRHRQV